MRLTDNPDLEILELKSQHLATSIWLIILIISLVVTASYPIAGKWYLFGLEMAGILTFQTYAIFLKRKIKRVNKTLLVREIMES